MTTILIIGVSILILSSSIILYDLMIFWVDKYMFQDIHLQDKSYFQFRGFSRVFSSVFLVIKTPIRSVFLWLKLNTSKAIKPLIGMIKNLQKLVLETFKKTPIK